MELNTTNNTISDATVQLSIIINGHVLSALYQVVSVKVAHETGCVPEAEVLIVSTIEEGEDMLESQQLLPGNAITVSCGWGAGSQGALFKGAIVRQVLEAANGSYFLNVLCSGTVPATRRPTDGEPVLLLAMGKSIINFRAAMKVVSLPMKSATKRAINGSVSFAGNGAIETGDNILLAHVGKNYNGPALVTRIDHLIAEGEWTTTTQFESVRDHLPEPQ